MTSSSTVPNLATRSSLTIGPAIALHLLPGVPLTLFAVVTAPLLTAAGLPAVWGLLIGVLVVQAPLLELLRRRIGPVHEPRPTAHPVALTAGVTVACLTLPGVVVWCEPLLRETVFGGLPTWWSWSPDATSSPAISGVTIVLWVAAAVIVGPIVEERWFRGVLLPRVPLAPWPAALAGAALFSCYHLWQPWAILTVFAFALPITIARSVLRLGVVGCSIAHCTVNAVLLVALIVGVLAR